MKSFALITTLYFCRLFSWICVSGSETQTVKVQPGEEVTLLCSNISKHPGSTHWFRLVNRTKPRCISSMYGSDGEASYCDGFQNGFKMSSNMSTVFLTIKQVDLSDSGLYFCGFYIETHTVIASATHLNVQGNCGSEVERDCYTEEEPDGTTNLMTVTLGGLTVFLTTVIIVLVVKIKKLKTAVTEEPQPERNKNRATDDLNYAAISFHNESTRNHRPTSEREVETVENVVYSATR